MKRSISQERKKILRIPYDWTDNYYKLNETQLPPKESFYSQLKVKDISDEDYRHAQVWETFK